MAHVTDPTTDELEALALHVRETRDFHIYLTGTQSDVIAQTLEREAARLRAEQAKRPIVCTRCNDTGQAPAIRGSRFVPGETMPCPVCIARAEQAPKPEGSGAAPWPWPDRLVVVRVCRPTGVDYHGIDPQRMPAFNSPPDDIEEYVCSDLYAQARRDALVKLAEELESKGDAMIGPATIRARAAEVKSR